uniref:Uncharacterized protein n=1 Tax=Noctiluca scintillans TaxID=2966 RepID=A0A7S1AWR0_NOCSC|mmetsp:Transcript_62743/g.166515  ORF Transcript_62743/g.166515 Transcript_62743/m.166515 type:complete len:571 (+) Transcript_62743:57-1769(+)
MSFPSVCKLLLASCVTSVASGGPTFLSHAHDARARLAHRDLGLALSEGRQGSTAPLGLSRGAEDHVQLVKEHLGTTWQALPKVRAGRVTLRSLRHVVHRYFLQSYGISMEGLGSTQGITELSWLMQAVPFHVREMLEGNGASEEFSLDDAVALILAIETVVEDSTQGALLDAYRWQQRSVKEDLSLSQMHGVLSAFLIRWAVGDTNLFQEVQRNTSMPEHLFDDWNQMESFARGILRSFEDSSSRSPRYSGRPQDATWNPLSERFSFSDASILATMVVTSFASFMEVDCQSEKADFARMDTALTGRVPVADFYQAYLNGNWRFSESTDYLRQVGALDESSSWHGPRVIITNYIHQPNNCMITTEAYSVCCRNECEDYMDELETKVAAPHASAQQLVSLVQEIASTHSDSPPEVSKTMRARLQEIAEANGGEVPLHGRLFAQWLHYMFPHECVFPHSGGAAASSSVAYSGSKSASIQEMRRHIRDWASLSRERDTAGGEQDSMSQWSDEEELMSDVVHLMAPAESRVCVKTCAYILFAVVLFLAFCHLRVDRGRGKDGHFVLPMASKQHMV